MKILVYKNNLNKDNISLIDKITSFFLKKNIDYEVIDENSLLEKKQGDVLIVCGGDGTILKVVNFAIINNLKILGINFGTLGFLTEFEKNDYIIALEKLINNELVVDERSCLSIIFKDKEYFSLNDAVLQRKYLDNYLDLVVKLEVKIDNNFVDYIKGDGVIVSTPTGSTAYSLSAGGSILAPNIKANILTPICAHSLKSKPIIYSQDSTCKIKAVDGSVSALYIDGKYIDDVKIGECVKMQNCNNKICFLREKDNNFYKILLSKFGKEI